MTHTQRIVLVKASVDDGIADLVLYLNTIPGVLTHASCQGTLGEGGLHSYRPQVMVTWETEEALERLEREFDISQPEPVAPKPWKWCYVHPKQSSSDAA